MKGKTRWTALFQHFSTNNAQCKAKDWKQRSHGLPEYVLRSAGLYLRVTILVWVWARVNGRWIILEALGGVISLSLSLSLSVCPRETWRSRCLDFIPEWALSGSDSPVELHWSHKASLFATVAARPHERESRIHNFSIWELHFTVDVRSTVCEGWSDCAWNLILLPCAFTVFLPTESELCPQLSQKTAVEWHWTFVSTLRLPHLFHGSLRWLDKVLFTVTLGYFWPH